jgi:ABC-type antimicrobial peptide transport system permease subunit
MAQGYTTTSTLSQPRCDWCRARASWPVSLNLGTLGGGLGVITGVADSLWLTISLPGLPVYVDEKYLLIGLLVLTATGLLSGVGPARRAIRVDPVEAFHEE